MPAAPTVMKYIIASFVSVGLLHGGVRKGVMKQ
jgi:hypothetical protein